MEPIPGISILGATTLPPAATIFLTDWSTESTVTEFVVTGSDERRVIAPSMPGSGFLPVSQLSSKNYPRVEDGDKNKILGMLKKLVAQELDVRILDADRESEKLIVSEKATQKERDRKVISGMKVDDVIEGEVSGVVDFGAFIKFFPAIAD